MPDKAVKDSGKQQNFGKGTDGLEACAPKLLAFALAVRAERLARWLVFLQQLRCVCVCSHCRLGH